MSPRTLDVVITVADLEFGLAEAENIAASATREDRRESARKIAEFTRALLVLAKASPDGRLPPSEIDRLRKKTGLPDLLKE